MNQSSAIAAATNSLFDAMNRGDADAFLRLLSPSSDLLGIGSDPDEWWAGYDTMAPVIRAQVAEMGAFPFVAEQTVAFESGDLGWSATQATLKVPDMPPAPMRLSCVYSREGGEWKIVHFHLSSGVRNEDVLGVELTTDA
jgi:ketosteroid isomerase-like protein